ncbi:MAG: hypothetical protein C5B44_05185 [Acidobacteria bacterium]|nr:MAG: hypothetical protein C5B44_05185 [Acidobacteriota bacterium]
MDAPSINFIAIIAAATVPFVLSILSVFSSKTRVREIEGYFLYDRQLDIDSFLKTTIGYSLQVASVALLFYWTFTNGPAGSLAVALAWTAGYLLLARVVGRGKLNAFLLNKSAETVHGFIGERTAAPSKRLVKLSILAVAFASIIGLGGTMMTEVDYSTQFFLSSVGVTSGTIGSRLVIELVIIIFIAIYVLWGGYKASVFTDRYQVPIAYVAFSIFGFGEAAQAKHLGPGHGISLVVSIMGILLAILFVRRIKLLLQVSPDDSRDMLTALLTFVPILVLAGAVLFYLRQVPGQWSITALWGQIWQNNNSFLGFGVWGFLALMFANGVWQFIDISGFQRLQSLDKEELATNIQKIAKTIKYTGIEAGIGWALIIFTAVILRMIGLTNDNFLIPLSSDLSAMFLVPIFIFTVSVYMHSTIACFMSALSYISYYDIVPKIINIKALEPRLDVRLGAARVTTALVVAVLFFLYVVLRTVVPEEAIPAVLFGIYAFQITIMPSAILALFFPSVRLHPSAIIGSISVGMVIALISAVYKEAWPIFGTLGMDENSWTVIPPLASALTACLVYASIHQAIWLWRARRAWLWKARKTRRV